MNTNPATADVLRVEERAPAHMAQPEPGVWVADFGRAAFAQLTLALDAPAATVVRVHVGEKLDASGRVDRRPGCRIRYAAWELSLKPGRHRYAPEMPWFADDHNRGMKKMPLPAGMGNVLPYRYLEIEGYDQPLRPDDVRQRAVFHVFDDDAAHFACDHDLLNRIWELCRYSMKATSALGVFIDGDRERAPMSGDTYVNQLGWYLTSGDDTLARRSIACRQHQRASAADYELIKPISAWLDYLYTGNDALAHEELSKGDSACLLEWVNSDGLLDIAAYHRALGGRGKLAVIDWPRGGDWSDCSDGYRIEPVNAVCNALLDGALQAMAQMAQAVGRHDQAEGYRQRAASVRTSYQQAFWDAGVGAYRDAVGCDHHALHATMYPLAFGLVPADAAPAAMRYVVGKGMACSVYGAQFLIDGLFRYGADAAAFDLLTGEGTWSWANMLKLGATITHEAWDPSLKNNEDWNHAWGAAPANLIPRHLVGVEPIEPGWRRFRVRPANVPLQWHTARIPTPRGPITSELQRERNDALALTVTVPPDSEARLDVPRQLELQRVEGNGTPPERDGVIHLPAGKWQIQFADTTVRSMK